MKEEGGNPDTDRDLELALSLHRNLNWAGRERSRHSRPAGPSSDQELAAVHAQASKKRKLHKKGSLDLDKLKVKEGRQRGPKSPLSPASRSTRDATELKDAAFGFQADEAALTSAVRRAWSLAGEDYRVQWGCLKCFVAGQPWGRLVRTDALASPASLLRALGPLGKDLTPTTACVVALDGEGRSTVLRPPLEQHDAGKDRRSHWARTLEGAQRLYITHDVSSTASKS